MSATPFGASLTGLTVKVIVPVVLKVPSETLNVTESGVVSLPS